MKGALAVPEESLFASPGLPAREVQVNREGVDPSVLLHTGYCTGSKVLKNQELVERRNLLEIVAVIARAARTPKAVEERRTVASRYYNLDVQ